MMLKPKEQALVERLPRIEWMEPQSIEIAAPDGPHRVEACRFCIALYGTKAQDLLKGIGVIPPGGLSAHIEAEHQADL